MDVETVSTLSEQESLRSAGQRRFAPAKTKIGQARQTREAVKHTLTHNNPKRVGPIALPLDYENFCTRNKTALDNDPLRELSVFPRDDITVLELEQEEKTVESIWSVVELSPAWHLTKVCLNLYSRPLKLLVFNYGKFAGDYRRTEPAADQLEDLNYEFDLIEDEVMAEKHVPETRIVMEGWLTSVPDSSNFIDHMRSGKRRYAYVRHSTVDDTLELTLHKDKHAPVHSSIQIQHIAQRTKKGKELIEIVPVGVSAEQQQQGGRRQQQQQHVFAVDSEAECRRWLDLVNAATLDLAQAHKANDDSVSVGSGTTQSSETTVNSDDTSTQHMWQGRAAGRALQPSPVNTIDIFQLYSDLEPVTASSSRGGNLLQCVSPSNARSRRPAPKVTLVVGCKEISIKLPTNNDSFDQVEPFFVRLYLVDGRTGQRVSEELHVTKDCVANMWRRNMREQDVPAAKDEVQRMAEWVCQSTRQAVFTVGKPSSELFVLVRVERVLQPQSTDAYVKPDVKAAHKLQKNASLACQRLGQYRMAFAWTAKPVFAEFISGAQDKLSLYKCEPDKSASEADVARFIADISRQDHRSSKQQPLPNCCIQLHIDLSANTNELTSRLSSTLLRVKPFAPEFSVEQPSPAAGALPPPILEGRVFNGDLSEEAASHSSGVEPHSTYVNELYVYPMQLRYDTQRTFGKARNIVCRVRLMCADDMHTASQPVNSMAWRLSGEPPPGSSSNSRRTVLQQPLASHLLCEHEQCAVTHHSQTPVFNEEFKLHLPVRLTNRHYLLFTFGHVAVNAVMTAASPGASDVEQPCGFAWLPLVRADRLFMEHDLQEFTLPVAAECAESPQGFPAASTLALDSHGQPDLKLVDNGRPLFRVRVRLVSSVFSTEAKLQRFFQGCASLQRSVSVCSSTINHSESKSSPSASSSADNECEEAIRRAAVALQSVPPARVLPFLPAVLTQLLQLLPQSSTEALAVAALSTLIYLVELAQNCGHEATLRDFVKLQYERDKHMSADPLAAAGLHESLCKLLPLLLRPAHADQSTITSLLKHSWFFLEITCKSMGLHLLATGLYKSSRMERFPAELLFRLDSVVQSIVPLLVAHQHTHPAECRQANQALANFFRVCLSFLDRGTVLKLIYYYMERMDKCEQAAFRDYKLDMLLVLSQHEHWLPLSLPLICNSQKVLTAKQGGVGQPDEAAAVAQQQVNGESATRDESISSGFWQRFMESVFGASNRSGRRQCCSHDEELYDELQLSEGYCSRHFLPAMLLHEVQISFAEQHEHRRRAVHILRNLMAKHTADPRYVDERCRARIASLYLPLLSILLDCCSELQAVKAATAPAINTLASVNPATGTAGGTVSSRLSVDTHTTATTLIDSGRGEDQQQQQQLAVGGNERLTVGECRDLLLVALHVLRHAPESHLAALWHHALTHQLHNWCTMLELCVHMFAYRGRRATMLKTHTTRTRGDLHQLKPTTSHRLSLNLSVTSAEPADSRGHSPVSPIGWLTKQMEQAEAMLFVVDGDDWSVRTITAANKNTPFNVLQECHLAQQASLIVLRVLAQFTSHCKARLESELEDSQHLLRRVLGLYLTLLGTRCSQAVRLHTCAALAVFVKKFERQLFVDAANAANEKQCCMLSMLCSALLSQLSSKLVPVQRAAAALIQVLLRTSYEFAGRHNWLGQLGTGMSVALAHLLSSQNAEAPSGTDSLQLQRGLTLLHNLANANRHTTHFDQLVMELVSQLRDILSCTGALREAESHPYRLCELHVRLADSFRACAPLRQAWLEALAAQHEQTNEFSEAAMCHLHIAAIMARQLQLLGLHDVNWRLLAVLSDNVVLEERDAAGSQTQPQLQPASYSLNEYCSRVEHAAKLFVKANRQEALGPLYRLIVPLYEMKRDYQALSEAYRLLQDAYSYAAQMANSDKRSLATYFRVIFYNQVFFGEEHGREWVYKMAGHTSLAEAADRIRQLVINHIGHERIEFCAADDTQLSTAALDDDKAYVQITHVEPLLDDAATQAAGSSSVQDQYSLHTNVRRFFFECKMLAANVAPPDSDQHGAFNHQLNEITRLGKRRIILTTSHSFACMLARLSVVSRGEQQFSPLAVAIEQLRHKASQLRRTLALRPLVDAKRLQLQLQGCVQTTVNVGPLVYAEAFTDEKQRQLYGEQSLAQLSSAFRELMSVCEEALQVNAQLISADQIEYHRLLTNSHANMVQRLTHIFGLQVMNPAAAEQQAAEKKTPPATAPKRVSHVFNSISAVDR